MWLFLKAILTFGIGVTITYICIVLEFDWKWACFFNANDLFVVAAVPFVVLGMIVPLLIPLVFIARYRKTQEHRFLILTKRSFGAFVSAYGMMTLLKVFTNRVDMEPFQPIGVENFSNQFRFGFMNSNHWWESFSEGWPSGHTMIAVAMALSIHGLLKNKTAKILNVFYPICIALSVSTAFHWLSDVIVGGILGIALGKYFSTKFDLHPS